MNCGCGLEQNWCVKAGATFAPTLRWAQKTLAAAAITAISQGTPVAITAPGHGLPNGWPAAVVGVNGMSFINSPSYPPYLSDLHQGVVVDSNTVQFNDVSSALWPAYISPGGSLVWYEPQALTGVTFSMAIYAQPPEQGGTPLVTLTNGSGITVDTVNMLILPVLQTDALPAGWPTNNIAYYTLTATDTSGVVTEVMFGSITVE
jgi:hypothetical protein